jgi:hypothetical protein
MRAEYLATDGIIRLAQIIIPSLLKLIRSNELAAPASASSSDAAIVP